MHLMPLLLMIVVLAVGNGLTPLGAHWGVPTAVVLGMAWVSAMAIVMAAWGVETCVDRRLARGQLKHSLEISEWNMRVSRWLLLASHVIAVMVFDSLGAVRSLVGDWVLLDELLAVLPPLVGLGWLFWIHYSIERRLRESTLIRRLDEGHPVYPTLTRRQYVVLQVRLQMLLTLVPVLLIVGLSETLKHVPAFAHGQPLSWLEHVAALFGALGIFMFAPLLARVLLDVQPLPAGPLRDDLQAVCDRHNVRMRDLLLWNTNGSMINAAVMGLVGPLRYVMITDMLLETLRREQVQAVMAHEIGHVRRHHMPWMVVCLLAAMALAWVLVVVPMNLAANVIAAFSMGLGEAVNGASFAGQLIVGLLMFGWISRRFERQADTFAVQHMSGLASGNASPDHVPIAHRLPGNVIQPDSVLAMQNALQVIAVLNAVPTTRQSWRHGSIRWRQQYLASITGKPIANLPIDRLVKWIKIVSAMIVVTVLGAQAVLTIVDSASAQDHRRSQELQRAEYDPVEPAGSAST